MHVPILHISAMHVPFFHISILYVSAPHVSSWHVSATPISALHLLHTHTLVCPGAQQPWDAAVKQGSRRQLPGMHKRDPAPLWTHLPHVSRTSLGAQLAFRVPEDKRCLPHSSHPWDLGTAGFPGGLPGLALPGVLAAVGRWEQTSGVLRGVREQRTVTSPGRASGEGNHRRFGWSRCSPVAGERRGRGEEGVLSVQPDALELRVQSQAPESGWWAPNAVAGTPLLAVQGLPGARSSP